MIETLPFAFKLGLAVTGIPASLIAIKSVASIALQDKMIYNGYFPPGSRRAIPYPEKYGLERNFREEFIKSTDGVRLQVWRFASIVSEPEKAPTLLYFQGNGGNLGHRMKHLKLLMQYTGANIFALHYRGYGRSGGRSTERGIQKDARAFLKFVDSLDTFRRDKYYLFGHSLEGGAVAIDLAADLSDRFSLLIVENTFESVKSMVRSIYPRWSIYPYLTPFLWNHWDSMSNIQKVDCPVLFLVAKNDEIVPSSHSFSLASQVDNKVPNLIHEFKSGLHDNTWQQPGYGQTIKDFIDKHVENRNSLFTC